MTVSNLTNQEKSQLLDIILWAGDSLRHRKLPLTHL
jgi:hypothetical protein